jgi:hypothetical protein
VKRKTGSTIERRKGGSGEWEAGKLHNFYSPHLNLSDFDIAWEEAWKHCIENLVKKQGWNGFREGTRLLQQREGTQRMGTIISLKIEVLRPIKIYWDNVEIQNYTLTELKCLGVTRIEPIVKLSPNVAYQISENWFYFRAWI